MLNKAGRQVLCGFGEFLSSGTRGVMRRGDGFMYDRQVQHIMLFAIRNDGGIKMQFTFHHGVNMAIFYCFVRLICGENKGNTASACIYGAIYRCKFRHLSKIVSDLFTRQ